MTKRLPFLLALVLLCSCAGFVSMLPKVLADITEASIVIDHIEHFVNDGFALLPNPGAQKVVASAIQRARDALAMATRTANGAQALDANQADAALNDFRVAYADLLKVVAPFGVKQTSAGAFSVGVPGELLVPEPMGMKRMVSDPLVVGSGPST